MRESRRAIAKLNVLRSSDTEPEKSEEYKKCINGILPDVEVLDICFNKDVNLGLIRSMASANAYNSVISLDPKRHLTPAEFKKIKELRKQHYAKDYN